MTLHANLERKGCDKRQILSIIFHPQSGDMFYPRSRRSLSISRYPMEPIDYSYRWRSSSVEPRHTTHVSHSSYPITMIGSRYHHYTPSSYYQPRSYGYSSYYPYHSSSYYDYPSYSSYSYKYAPTSRYSYYTPHVRGLVSPWYDNTLPTSHLRATDTAWVHVCSVFILLPWLSFFTLFTDTLSHF